MSLLVVRAQLRKLAKIFFFKINLESTFFPFQVKNLTRFREYFPCGKAYRNALRFFVRLSFRKGSIFSYPFARGMKINLFPLKDSFVTYKLWITCGYPVLT